MFSALGLTLLLSATPLKVAVPGPSVVGLEAAVADAWVDRFVTLLGRDGALKLITQRDIAQTLGLERQKQLLGCPTGATSCLAELAGALGVDAILSINLAKTGESFNATLRALDANTGLELASATGRLKSDEALQDWLEAQVPVLSARLLEAFHRAPPAASARVVPIVLAAASLAVGAAGGVLFGLSRVNAQRLRDGVDSTASARELASSGRTLEGAGLALIIAGGVALAASTAWLIAAPTQAVQVVVVPAPGGGALAIGGTF